MNKEQAKQILILASKYADQCGINELECASLGFVKKSNMDKEHSLWSQLEALVNSFVEEE